MSGPSHFVILPASTGDDLAAVTRLFRDYAASLDVDLAYQDFDSEVASLPGKYGPPRGALLLARLADGTPAGCVALRALESNGCCEMKRLYVAPAGRRIGLGRALVEAATAHAARMGYREIWLDTLPSMKEAQALYRSAGFKEMAPYYDTPVAGTAFLRLEIPVVSTGGTAPQ
jgi:ribosomal protein S18 acetylase RimI-like enzyme